MLLFLQKAKARTLAKGVGKMDMDYWNYDELDMESRVLRGYEEDDESMDEAEKGFLRGYLGMGEI